MLLAITYRLGELFLYHVRCDFGYRITFLLHPLVTSPLLPRPTVLTADGLFGGGKYGTHTCHFSQYTLALDLLSGESLTRSVVAIFRAKEFARTTFHIETKMAILKSSLAHSLPEAAFGDLPRKDIEKSITVTIKGISVDDDYMFGLCDWSRGKVASSDDNDIIVIHVFLREGMDGSSSGSNHANTLTVG